MNKNQLLVASLVVILVAVVGYWLGYRDGSSRRFIPYAESHTLAFDSHTGQLCRTFSPSPQPQEEENELSEAGCPTNILDASVSSNPDCVRIVRAHEGPSKPDNIPQCKNLK
jgi:hypothetical protein